jgi:hypothetical protein
MCAAVFQVPLLMPNRFGARSIHTAAREGHVSVVNTLIKKGESVDARTGDGLTALHIAVECGKVHYTCSFQLIKGNFGQAIAILLIGTLLLKILLVRVRLYSVYV